MVKIDSRACLEIVLDIFMLVYTTNKNTPAPAWSSARLWRFCLRCPLTRQAEPFESQKALYPVCIWAGTEILFA